MKKSKALEKALSDVSNMGQVFTMWVVVGRTTGHRAGLFCDEESARNYADMRNGEIGRKVWCVEPRHFPKVQQ